MSERVAALADKIRGLEEELELEIARRRAELKISIDGSRVIFEKGVLDRQRKLKKAALRYLAEAHPLTILTAPVIYALVVPIALLDLSVSIYQMICFSAWGIQKVNRGDFLVLDRARLAYLNAIEKVNCAYCSYANGVLSYAREIAGRTEQYWCPIKHARRILGTHAHYKDFLEFGDADAYRSQLKTLRDKLAELPGP